MKSIYFQFISTYFQLIFLLSLQDIDKKWFQLKPNYFQFVWIYFAWFPFLNFNNILMLSTFSGFSFWTSKNILIRKDFNWNQFVSIQLNLLFFSLKKSIDKKGFHLKWSYFQFISIYFQFIFLLNPKAIAPKVYVHKRVPSNNYMFEDLGHSWGTLLKNGLGAFLSKGSIRL